MADRPIIFSGSMVLALLDGRKTQTRRLATSPLRQCQVGDRLYVRENFLVFADDHGWEDYHERQGTQPDRTIVYAADRMSGPMAPVEYETPSNARRQVNGRLDADETWTAIGTIPCLLMPRWASRLTLIVEDVRFQRLHEISEGDCLTEGAEITHGMGSIGGPLVRTDQSHIYATPRNWYRTLWGSLHDKPGQRWDENPEIVALTFRIVRDNIDRLPA